MIFSFIQYLILRCSFQPFVLFANLQVLKNCLAFSSGKEKKRNGLAKAGEFVTSLTSVLFRCFSLGKQARFGGDL